MSQMDATKKHSRLRWLGLMAGMLIAAAIIAALLMINRSGAGMVRHLPDGSKLMLDKIEVISGGFQYSYKDLPKPLRMIEPILPQFVRARFGSASGSLGIGSDGSTNLVVVTIHRHDGQRGIASPERLRVWDEQGNSFDACLGASTLGMQNAVVKAWQIRCFPRRSRKVLLEFLTRGRGGKWITTTHFEIPNPLYSKYPQWTPEPVPTTKHDGELAVTLAEFQSRGESPGDRGDTATRLVLLFSENGVVSHNWRVQKLIISDATGNHWFPYLDFVKQHFAWTSNGVVKFFGALWPEETWKLNCELIRIAGLSSDDLWDLSLSLPAPQTVMNLTNRWERDGVTVSLIALAAPETDHKGDFKWVAKWWGEEKRKVYSLAVEIEPKLEGKRLVVLGESESDSVSSDVKIMQHGSQDSSKQAVFFKAAPEATSVRLKLALQRSRFVEFVAKPSVFPVGRDSVEP